jgi:hypothetical protein
MLVYQRVYFQFPCTHLSFWGYESYPLWFRYKNGTWQSFRIGDIFSINAYQHLGWGWTYFSHHFKWFSTQPFQEISAPQPLLLHIFLFRAQSAQTILVGHIPSNMWIIYKQKYPFTHIYNLHIYMCIYVCTVCYY